MPGVCDATARIHELRTEGMHIVTLSRTEHNPDGSFNLVGLYVLFEGPSPQGDLFRAADDEGATG